jgi:hypothetical protein
VKSSQCSSSRNRSGGSCRFERPDTAGAGAQGRQPTGSVDGGHEVQPSSPLITGKRRVAPAGFPTGAPSEPCVPLVAAHGSSKNPGHLRADIAAAEVAKNLTATEVARLTSLTDESKAAIDQPHQSTLDTHRSAAQSRR